MDPYIPQEFQDHELIKTVKVFWLYDPGCRKGYGWPLPVYFDRTSNEYLVFNCPTYATTYRTSEIPEDGDFEFVPEVPWQYASDASTPKVKVNVR